MWNLVLRLTHPNCILRIKFLRIRAKITKISFVKIYSTTTYDRKNVCPQGIISNYLQNNYDRICS